MIVPAGSGAAVVCGGLGMATGAPGGSGTWPVVSGGGGIEACRGPVGGGVGPPGGGAG
ncbi:hypothetical protein GCM10010415_33720 [Streptomyces atrovirens]